jgi:hypothetical protein
MGWDKLKHTTQYMVGACWRLNSRVLAKRLIKIERSTSFGRGSLHIRGYQLFRIISHYMGYSKKRIPYDCLPLSMIANCTILLKISNVYQVL